MRTRDAAFHNEIANHPDVIRYLEWNPDNGLMTFDHLANDDRFYLMHLPLDGPELPGLALVFEWSAPGVFQVHTMSHPDRRHNVLWEAKFLIHEILMMTGASRVWGQTAMHNIAARKFNLKIARVLGYGEHHISGPCEYFGGQRTEWLARHWNNAEDCPRM